MQSDAVTEFAVEVQKLSKRYAKKDTFAFENIGFQLPRNKVLSLIGSNGSGKSSLLEIISGTRRPTSGMVTVFGKNPSGMRGRIGYIPQRFGLFDELTVEENVRYFSKMYGADVDIQGLMEHYGVSDYSGKRYSSLSGGMKRRTEITCILAGDPDLIIMDEPSAGLDTESCRELWEMIDEMKGVGKTLIIASHEIQEAKKHSDYILMMKNGEQTYWGRPDDIWQTYIITIISDIDPEGFTDGRRTVIGTSELRRVLEDLRVAGVPDESIDVITGEAER